MSEATITPAFPSHQVTYVTEETPEVHDMARRTAQRYLEIGVSYTVERIHQGIDIFLREFPGIAFHIHLFAPA